MKSPVHIFRRSQNATERVVLEVHPMEKRHDIRAEGLVGIFVAWELKRPDVRERRTTVDLNDVEAYVLASNQQTAHL